MGWNGFLFCSNLTCIENLDRHAKSSARQHFNSKMYVVFLLLGLSADPPRAIKIYEYMLDIGIL
jgi:hypothetical protein